MDEPAAGLPEAEIPRFATAVSAVRDRGAGVLLVDHNVALVLEVCERIHVLDQGTTLAEGTPDEIRAAPRRRRRLPRRERGGRGARMTALAVEKLSVRYGAVEAVRGLSLEVKPGQIVGLIGPNGAGKSSTLHAIMGSAPDRRRRRAVSTDGRSSGGGRRTWRGAASRSCPKGAASSAS